MPPAFGRPGKAERVKQETLARAVAVVVVDRRRRQVAEGLVVVEAAGEAVVLVGADR